VVDEHVGFHLGTEIEAGSENLHLQIQILMMGNVQSIGSMDGVVKGKARDDLLDAGYLAAIKLAVPDGVHAVGG
jgi:hypothetical protein